MEEPEKDIAERVRAILHERQSDLTKQACDECEQCGPVVMCSYHSLLSELAGHVRLAAAPSGEAQKVIADAQDLLIAMEADGESLVFTTMIRRLIDALAASQGVSVPAVAEIEQEMREWEWKRPGCTDNDLAKMKEWADRLAALCGDTK